MEPPSVVSSENVRAEKLKVLKSLRNYSQDTIVAHTVKGQYTRGNVGGVEVNSYLEDIEKYQSNTDTFVALKVFVDNWRWKGVPFFVRTGKRLKKQQSEIVITFKPVSHNIFEPKEEILNNKLIIKLQPQEGIELVQMTKIPGPGGYRYKPISLELDYLDSFNERLPDAYERLIIDVIRGNQTLFMSEHELEAAWLWIESITSNWQKLGVQNVLYRAGTDGPGNAVLNPGDKWNN
jgi:glucose-6-phosphate 1-dehydrogenase